MSHDIFLTLLQAARARKQKRLERLARLISRARPATPVPSKVIDVRAIRATTGLSQSGFAELLGIELATLRNWEQGRREPTGAARALLRAIRTNPIEVIKALSD